MPFGKPPLYGLAALAIGEEVTLTGDKALLGRARRSAHNYNVRSDMHFLTRHVPEGLYVKRLR